MTAVVPRRDAEQAERAARIRRAAGLVAAIVSDLAEFTEDHADDLAAWWAQRRRS